VIIILSTHIVDDVSQLCTAMAILDHGSILLDEAPASASARLKGKVWEKEVGRFELDELKATQKVISTRLFAGAHRARVYGDSVPGPGFIPVAPTLEDVYFLTVLCSREEETCLASS